MITVAVGVIHDPRAASSEDVLAWMDEWNEQDEALLQLDVEEVDGRGRRGCP